jgi:hypothetical protein
VEQGVNPLGGGAPIGCNPLTIAGQADRPFVFFEPILVPARTAIVITCFNPSNGVPIEAHYLLGGMKAVSVTQ